MLNAPIAEGANIFIWIVCLGAGMLAAIITIDNLKPKKKDNKSSE